MNYPICKNKGSCIFRDEKKRCLTLRDTKFEDRECHFRKESIGGKNMYDKRYGNDTKP